MKGLPIFRLVLILAIAWNFGFSSMAAAAAKPNIVFLLADDMRPDCIHALGHPVVQTPHLDALVKSGFAFSRAVAAYPICFVSRAEILTGTPAFRNGVGYRGNVIDPSLKTWAATLHDAGYVTWYSGKWHNDGQPRQRGYDETRGLFSSGGGPKTATMLPDHAGRKATGYTGWTFKTNDGAAELDKGVGLTPDTDTFIGDAAVELINRKPARPFFLHVNFTSPHDPRILPRGLEHLYDGDKIPLPANFRPQHPFDHGNLNGRDEFLLPKPLQEAEVRAELAAYYACITHVDEQVGRIVRALEETGQLANTIVVFSSDQGLAVGSHGLLGKQNLYEHTFEVPFIFRGPGIPSGTRSVADAYLRDVFPTTCELAGVPIPSTVESQSLAPILQGRKDRVHDFVIGYYTNAQRGIRKDGWKLIRYPLIDRTQLFDLKNDPFELHDLSADLRMSDRVVSLRKQMDDWLQAHGDNYAGEMSPSAGKDR